MSTVKHVPPSRYSVEEMNTFRHTLFMPVPPRFLSADIWNPKVKGPITRENFIQMEPPKLDAPSDAITTTYYTHFADRTHRFHPPPPTIPSTYDENADPEWMDAEAFDDNLEPTFDLFSETTRIDREADRGIILSMNLQFQTEEELIEQRQRKQIELTKSGWDTGAAAPSEEEDAESPEHASQVKSRFAFAAAPTPAPTPAPAPPAQPLGQQVSLDQLFGSAAPQPAAATPKVDPTQAQINKLRNLKSVTKGATQQPSNGSSGAVGTTFSVAEIEEHFSKEIARASAYIESAAQELHVLKMQYTEMSTQYNTAMQELTRMASAAQQRHSPEDFQRQVQLQNATQQLGASLHVMTSAMAEKEKYVQHLRGKLQLFEVTKEEHIAKARSKEQQQQQQQQTPMQSQQPQHVQQQHVQQQQQQQQAPQPQPQQQHHHHQPQQQLSPQQQQHQQQQAQAASAQQQQQQQYQQQYGMQQPPPGYPHAHAYPHGQPFPAHAPGYPGPAQGYPPHLQPPHSNMPPQQHAMPPQQQQRGGKAGAPPGFAPPGMPQPQPHTHAHAPGPMPRQPMPHAQGPHGAMPAGMGYGRPPPGHPHAQHQHHQQQAMPQAMRHMPPGAGPYPPNPNYRYPPNMPHAQGMPPGMVPSGVRGAPGPMAGQGPMPGQGGNRN